MRTLPLLFAAALVTVTLPIGLAANSDTPSSSNQTRETALAAPDSPAEPVDTPTPAAASEQPPQAPSAASSTAVPPAAPQVITAQIDPELALRLSLLEKTLLAQSHDQAALYSETTRLLMFFGSACVAMGLIAMIAAVFLMNRTLASVSAITTQVAQVHASTPALPSPATLVPAGGSPSGFEKVQASGQRFQSRMTSLEQRLEELENLAGHGTASPRPAETTPAPGPANVPGPAEDAPAPQRVVPLSAILVRKAETLLNLGKLDEAMAALDEAARHDGDPAEIHLARGRVQEKLGRLADALHSYDLAAASDQSSTAALLMKAGVLNRQERFEEALSCYERALALHRASA